MESVLLQDDQPEMDAQVRVKAFIAATSFESKEDIEKAVVNYHKSSTGRSRSLDRAKEATKFAPPTVCVPHMYAPDNVDCASFSASRYKKTRHISMDEDARDLFVRHGRRRQHTQQNLLPRARAIATRVFGTDNDQFSYLTSYAVELNKREHFTRLETHGDVFLRVAFVYRSAAQAPKPFSCRGLSVDGTSLEGSSGGTLLVACFRIGNFGIAIVGITVVSAENDSNWSWFIDLLLGSLEDPPTFTISDRHKGLLSAMTKYKDHVHYVYCFRHVMENFNRRFKNKMLRNQAWRLARATSRLQYGKHVDKFKSANPEAFEWLCEIGVEKWALAFSPVPRFGMLTPSNVESISNNIFRQMRKLSVLDILLEVERDVSRKAAKWNYEIPEWNLLAPRIDRKLQESLESDQSAKVEQMSRVAFVVSTQKRKGAPPRQFSLLLGAPRYTCSCGVPVDMLAPCKHVLAYLRATKASALAALLFHSTWTTSHHRVAFQENVWVTQGPVVKDMLMKNNMYAPSTTKTRRRRKHNHRESQAASSNLQKVKAPRTCSVCHHAGHNKRHHKQDSVYCMWVKYRFQFLRMWRLSMFAVALAHIVKHVAPDRSNSQTPLAAKGCDYK